MRRQWIGLAGLVLCIAGGAGPSAAKGRQPNEAAAELDALGKAAYKKKRWDDAIAAFEGAYEADPLPKFLFNMARCYEKKGDPARASHYFERYLKADPRAKDKKRVKALAKMLRVRLKKEFSQAQVTSKPDGAFVRVRLESGDIVEGTTPFSEWLPFGTHRLEVTKDGYQRFGRELVVQPKTTATAEVLLQKKEAPKPPAAVPAKAEAPKAAGEPTAKAGPKGPGKAEPKPAGEEPAATEVLPPPAGAGEPETSWAPWAALGTGAALLAGGAVAGLLARQDESARDELLAETTSDKVTLAELEEADEAARSKALASNVLLGAGGVAAAAGVVLLLVGGPDEAEDVSAGVVAAPGGVGVSVTWGQP